MTSGEVAASCGCAQTVPLTAVADMDMGYTTQPAEFTPGVALPEMTATDVPAVATAPITNIGTYRATRDLERRRRMLWIALALVALYLVTR